MKSLSVLNKDRYLFALLLVGKFLTPSRRGVKVGADRQDCVEFCCSVSPWELSAESKGSCLMKLKLVSETALAFSTVIIGLLFFSGVENARAELVRLALTLPEEYLSTTYEKAMTLALKCPKQRAASLPLGTQELYENCTAFGNPSEYEQNNHWWPASAIKTFPTYFTLEELELRKISLDSIVIYDDAFSTNRLSFREIIKLAIVDSDNAAYDRLSHWVGHQHLNEQLTQFSFTRESTQLNRGYSGYYKDPLTGKGTITVSPGITIKSPGGEIIATKPKTVSHWTAEHPCQNSVHGNCTTLLDLSAVLYKTWQHIPDSNYWKYFSEVLAAPRARGGAFLEGMIKGLSWGEAQVSQSLMMRKPGFADNWASDVILIDSPQLKNIWIVSAANHPGRESIRRIGEWVGKAVAEIEAAEHE